MNFLPEENKILFKKYYLRKLLTVFGVLIFSVVAVGIIILIPMYSLILSYKKDLSRELSVYLKKDAELANSAAALEIKKLNSRLDFVRNPAGCSIFLFQGRRRCWPVRRLFSNKLTTPGLNLFCKTK